MVKKRTPTICEWALGFTVEEYVANKERCQTKNGNGKASSRFKLEMSTDEESGEDSLKITYPRSDQTKGTSGVKKVRFEKTPQKSALKKPASETETETGTETTDATATTTEAEATTSEAEKSSDAAQSSDSSKASNKKKGKKHAMSSESSDATSSGDSEPDSDCPCHKCRHRTRHLTMSGKDKNKKKAKEAASESDSSDGEQMKQKKSPKNKKGSPDSNKSKKKPIPVPESENDGEDESSTEEETPKKARKGKGGKEKAKASEDKGDGDAKGKKKGGKDKGQKSFDGPTTDNNVGPGQKTSDTSDQPKTKGANKSKKPLPEPNLPPSLRRPNLILPVTAQVLQVEHAIEGMEDPRPNAFHDGQHGVVRVYHGPAYGNPFGTLYPIRDFSKATLPAGTPHPLMNPYLNGFKTTTNPGDLANQGNSHWNPHSASPVGSRQGQPPSPPQQAQAPGHMNKQTSSPPVVPTMSGALNSGLSNQMPGAMPQGWGPNVGHGAYPINVSMYSYGEPIRGDSWSKEGRERFARIARDMHKPERNIFQMMSGSCENNAGPAMYNRAAYRNGDHQGSNRGSNNGGQSKPVHPDLLWGTDKPGEATTASWVNQHSGNIGGPSGDGNNDHWCPSNTQQNDNGWGGTGDDNANNNSNHGSNRSNNSKAESNNLGSWNNSPHASNNSNKSGGSKKSNTQAATGDPNSWGGEVNNVGFSSGASNNSGESKGSKNSNKSNKSQNDPGSADWTNNAGPVQPEAENDPWGVKTDDPSKNMPGAYNEDQGGAQNATFVQTGTPKDNGGYFWGDTSAAQGTSAAEGTAW